MRPLSRLDILTLLRPIYMPIFFALVLYACQSDGEVDTGAARYDTNRAEQSLPTGSLTPAADQFSSGDLAAGGDTFMHVFDTTGEFPYYCRYHGGPDGKGMSGRVRVTQAQGTPKTYMVEITGYEYPDLNVSVGDTVVWINRSEVMHTVQSDYLPDSLNEQ